LLLIVLTLSTIAFTGGVYVLVQRIFQNFGPGVEADLIWKTVRGAQEMAHAADLGIAVKDARMVTEGLDHYLRSDDVMGISAIAADGSPITSTGQLPEPPDKLFSGPPGVYRRMPEYFVAWAPAVIEGSPVGRVALVVRTRRLVEAQALLRRMSLYTGVAGLGVLVLGVLFVNFFTRSIVERDAQLAEYASGLEQKVALRTVELDRANEGMRLVLDNVEQGFITVALDGSMANERSTIVDRWFGPPPPDGKFTTLIRPSDEKAATWFAEGCDSLQEGFMPAAVVLDQFPKQMKVGNHTLRMSYIGIGQDDIPDRLLVVLSDITEELTRERVERDARELTRAFQRIAADRSGFEQFFAEARGIVKEILAGTAELSIEKRLIHTLKGNCNIFGIDSVAESCHRLETLLQDEGRGTTESDRAKLGAEWERVAGMISGLLGDRRNMIELDEDEYQKLLAALRGGTGGPELITLVEGWRLEPVSLRLMRLSDKARYMAEKVNKVPLSVHVQGAGVRLDAGEWAPFWNALVHAVNNAVDHGIETSDERKAQGKLPGGNLWLSAEENGDALVISLRDDGRGIDWERLKEKARVAGLPHASRKDLVEALLTDGVSTKDSVSVLSGRGVGMGAVREATAAMGGHIEVTSEPKQGTTFEFRFPRQSRGHGSAAPSTKAVG